MSNIEVYGMVCRKYKTIAKAVAEEVVELMEQPDGIEVVIKFVSKKEIRRLNKETRNIDKVTDVLSYPSFELSPNEKLNLRNDEINLFKSESGFIHFGDMAICFAQTKKQAKEFGNSVASEIKKLVIHSMLHLMGYDHMEDEEKAEMRALEKEIMKKLGIFKNEVDINE